MSNLAIIVGVSEYQNSAMNLSACKADAALMNRLISGVGRFSDVLYVDTGATSASVKGKIVSFISANKGREIEEVFFYFTGHGDYSGEDFFFLLSDYDENRKSQTSLANSELDSLIRSLSPNLAVKVVDACHAGVQYIKDSSAISDYFSKSSKGAFEKCYFMFSSQADQPSWADSNLSFFTRSFVEAVAQYQGDEIRYKDIIDYISDDFKAKKQTPYFVTQSDFTETLGPIPDALKTTLKQALLTPTGKDNDSDKTKLSLLELIADKAKDYCTKEDAVEVINSAFDAARRYSFTAEIISLFELKVEAVEKLSGIPKLDEIAQWLRANKNDYFATIVYKDEHYQAPADPLDAILRPATLLVPDNRPTVTKTRSVISTFNIAVDDLPYKRITVDLLSKFPNIDSYHLSIIYLLSKTHLRFFYFFTNYVEKSWGSYSLNRGVEWRSLEVKLKDQPEVDTAISQIMTEFQGWVHDTIEKAYITTSTDNPPD